MRIKYADDNQQNINFIYQQMNQIRPFINRFVKQKQLQIADIHHDQNMKQIKPITTKLMQHSQIFTINNSKREMSKQVREFEIERENRLLLHKIQTVMSKKGNYSITRTKSINTKCNKSLNDIFRKKQLQSIQTQNQKFIMRLQTKKPTLNTLKLRKDWQDNKSVIKRMTNCQFHLTQFKTRTSRIRSLTSQRLFREKFEDFKITRLKTIDGHKMVIKMEFIDGYLKIIGDGRDHKDLKVIEIPKEQAVLYIQKECEGKAQNILQKLRYDQASQSLYILGGSSLSDLNPQKNKIHFKNQTISTLKNRQFQRMNKSTLQYLPQISKADDLYLHQTVVHRAQSSIQAVNSHQKLLQPQKQYYQGQNFESSYNKQDLQQARQKIKTLRKSITITIQEITISPESPQNYNQEIIETKPNKNGQDELI